MQTQIYWIVVTGISGSGQTTFVKTATAYSAYRDRRDMSLIEPEEYQRAQVAMQNWTSRYLQTGELGRFEERELVDRYQNSLLVGELEVMEGVYMCLYEAPPASRFDGAWEAIEEGLLGVVVMVDSAAPETFRDSAAVIGSIAEGGIAMVVAANKQDSPYATAPEDVAVLCQTGDIPVIGCVAHDREYVKRVLLCLLERLNNS